MLKILFRPLQTLALRIILLLIALGLFTSSGLYVAAWLAGPPGTQGGTAAIPLLAAGGLLLFKARSPGNPS